MLSTPDTDLDPAGTLSADLLAHTPETQVWRLLCARTLGEVDPMLAGIRADDIATELAATPGYRQLNAEAAAYLWLARTQGVSQWVDGR